jgi:uncharacterized protein GlcG (DUF336 family)
MSQENASSPELLHVRAISLEGAKQIVAAAEAEAEKNGWNVAIAVVDASGDTIVLHKRDGTQPSSVAICVGKARTAARWKRPSKVLEESVNGGRFSILAVEGTYPMEGGIPVIVDGQVIGAVGVSGVMAPQDAQVAQAGVDALRA